MDRTARGINKADEEGKKEGNKTAKEQSEGVRMKSTLEAGTQGGGTFFCLRVFHMQDGQKLCSVMTQH